MTQIEQILAEIGKRIERLKELMECSISDNRQVSIYEGKIETLSMFREYISSLQKQIISQPASDDLEQASIEHANKVHNDTAPGERIAACRYDFKAGAQWQKEQMMKGAVELGVWNYSNDTDMRALPIWGKEEFSHLKEDDMVKVIIIKE